MKLDTQRIHFQRNLTGRRLLHQMNSQLGNQLWKKLWNQFNTDTLDQARIQLHLQLKSRFK
jgi:hypothetical protein